MVLDCSPKILTLPRSDCAICIAGDTAATYPLMIQLANAIASHKPARDRSLDIRTLKPHLLRVFTDIINAIEDASVPIEPSDVQFIFGGYSWLSKTFEIWTIYYSGPRKSFFARTSSTFHPLLSKVAFIGDKAKTARADLVTRLNSYSSGKAPDHLEFEPFCVLRDLLRKSNISSTIGGPPQLIRIGEHMNTRVLAVKWPGGSSETVTLMGRQLFDYENVDNWILDPDTFKTTRPRAFGHRDP